MPVRLFQIDAFAARPFTGNPAAVCVLDAPAAPGWMAAVAAETDLPATAFVAPIPEGGPDAGADWALRWFTAVGELSLCGHGTLAASHVLLHELGWDRDEIRYATGAGVLTARSVPDEGAIELGFPAHAASPAPDDAAASAAALYADGSAPGLDTHRGFEDLLVVVPTVEDVLRVTPEPEATAALKARCVIVSSAADPTVDGLDVVSRVFASSHGYGEDAVTGSAHCLIGPYWAERLGRSRLRARQASARGGDLTVDVQGDRVALTGRAVTVLRSELDDAVLAGADA
jgi:PhzF family phenazine biosynthesis protein